MQHFPRLASLLSNATGAADEVACPILFAKRAIGDGRIAWQGLRAGMPIACKEAKIVAGAYHTRLFFTNGFPAS